MTAQQIQEIAEKFGVAVNERDDDSPFARTIRMKCECSFIGSVSHAMPPEMFERDTVRMRELLLRKIAHALMRHGAEMIEAIRNAS